MNARTHTQTRTRTHARTPHTNTYTHTHTHTHAETHIGRCWIVVIQSTYKADFYHQPEHLYIAGTYTLLKANQTVAATKPIQNVNKAHLPSREGHPSRRHPSGGHPSRRHPSARRGRPRRVAQTDVPEMESRETEGPSVVA